MLARQRQSLILEQVRKSGAVRVSELVEQLGVSDMTVRRDLDVLAGRGLVDKVYGGATSVIGNSTEEPGFEAKSVRQLVEKEAIGALAAKFVRPSTALGLSAGTTTWTFAHYLADIPDLTIVTNSTRIAEVLQNPHRPDRTVVLTGGVRTPSDALVGPIAVSTMSNLHLDLLFLGVHGMAAQSGLTTPNLEEGQANRAFIDSAAKRIVLADHTKWGTVGISTMADLGEADVLITDDRIEEDARTVLTEHVGELHIATPQRRGAATA